MSLSSVLAGRTIQGEFQEIASTLQDRWGFERVVIASGDENFLCEASWDFLSLLPGFISCFFLSESYKGENRSTIDYFYSRFGKERVNDVFQRYGVDIHWKYGHGFSLSRYDIEVLFLGLGAVHLEDLQEAYTKVCTKKALPWLSAEENRELMAALDNAVSSKREKLSQLNRYEINTLYKFMVPFQSTETIFLNHPPAMEKPKPDWGYGFESLRMAVSISESIRRSNIHFQKEVKKERYYQYRILKSLLSHGLPEGLIIPNARGIHAVHTWVEGGGTYKCFLKALGKDSEHRNIVTYLSTQFFSSVSAPWESILEDLRGAPGVLGIKTTYERTDRILSDPGKGFVDQPYEPTDFAGYSLGGAQAAKDACLFLATGAVHSFFGICNLGCESLLLEKFAERTLTLQKSPRIDFFHHQEDLVHHCGAGHLGLGTSEGQLPIRYHVLAKSSDDATLDLEEGVEEVVETPRVRPHAPGNYLSTLWRLSIAFAGAHNQDLSLKRLSVKVVEDPAQLQSLLDNRPLGFETPRAAVAIGPQDEFVTFWDGVEQERQGSCHLP